MAKRAEADASGPVDDNQARGAAQPVAAHGDGRGCARGGASTPTGNVI